MKKLFFLVITLSTVLIVRCVDCDVDDGTFMVWASLPWIPFRSCKDFLGKANNELNAACISQCTQGFNIFCKDDKNMVACLINPSCYQCVIANVMNRCNIRRGNNRNQICGIRTSSQGLSRISMILSNFTGLNNTYSNNTVDPFTGKTAFEESQSNVATNEFVSDINGTIDYGPATAPSSSIPPTHGPAPAPSSSIPPIHVPAPAPSQSRLNSEPIYGFIMCFNLLMLICLY